MPRLTRGQMGRDIGPPNDYHEKRTGGKGTQQGVVAMIRDGRRPNRSGVALALVLALAASVLAAGAPQSAAAAQIDACTGGSLQPNSLSAQWQWSGTRWQVYLSGYVTPVLAVGGAQVQLVTSAGGTWNLGAPTSDGFYYYWSGWVNQSDLGLYNPGGTSTFYLHFSIPLQFDRDTCHITGFYSVPPPTPTPVPTPAPNPGTIQTIFTITAGQQTTITQSGTPGAVVQFQTSTDLVTWYGLATATVGATGPATYTFAPTQTAFYRSYFYATGTTGGPVRGVVLPAPAPTPLPTPQPTPQPTPLPNPVAIPTIYTITLGASTTISNQGTPGATIQFESSRDNVGWTSLGSAVFDSAGSASLTFRPTTNLFLRSTMAGQSSPAVRGIVRQVAILRPTSSGKTKVVLRGATVTFATTIRPQTGVTGVARYRVYRWNGSAWALFTQGLRSVDAAGVARLVWRFTSPGRWYVRVMADPTASNASSVWSQVERYDVR